MKFKPLSLYVLGAALCGLWLALPVQTQAQTQAQADADSPALTALVGEVAAQQVTLIENQAKIDEQLALIAEDVRVARLFAARSGGKTK